MAEEIDIEQVTVEELKNWLISPENRERDAQFFERLVRSLLTEEIVEVLCGAEFAKRINLKNFKDDNLRQCVLNAIEAANKFLDIEKLHGGSSEKWELLKSKFNPRSLYIVLGNIERNGRRNLPALVYYHRALDCGADCSAEIAELEDEFRSKIEPVLKEMTEKVKKLCSEHDEKYLGVYVTQVCKRYIDPLEEVLRSEDVEQIESLMRSAVYEYLQDASGEALEMGYDVYNGQLCKAVEKLILNLFIYPYIKYLIDNKDMEENTKIVDKLVAKTRVKRIDDLLTYHFTLGDFDDLSGGQFLSWLNRNREAEQALSRLTIKNLRVRLQYLREFFRNPVAHGEAACEWEWKYLVYEVIFKEESLFSTILQICSLQEFSGNIFEDFDCEKLSFKITGVDEAVLREFAISIEECFNKISQMSDKKVLKEFKSVSLIPEASLYEDQRGKVQRSLLSVPEWFGQFYDNLIRCVEEQGFVRIEEVTDNDIGTIVKSLRRQKQKKQVGYIETLIDKTFKLTKTMETKLNEIGFPWEPLVDGVEV